mgnify:CR=1 FL=1
MKKRLLVFLLLLCVMLSACGKTNVNKPDNAGDKTDTETKVDYALKYEDVLAKTYEFIKNIDRKVGPDDGMAGIWDAALALEDEALNEIGYTFKDLNGDDVSELLIGSFNNADDAFVNNEIYMIYTLKNDTPEFLLEGMSRNMYSLKDDGKFFYMGSNGAAYSMFGIYNISKNNEIECEDYYFTYPDDNDPAKIEIYHNEKGIFYREESEKLDITLDDFWTLQEDAAKGTVKLTATPFAKLDAAIIEKAMAVAPVPDVSLLDGEWVFAYGETDGYEFTAEEEGIESGISINISNSTAKYYSKTEFTDEKFDAELEIIEEPVYEGCGNDEWKVKFNTYNSTFGEDEEFYATLIDENTLLLRHLFPFDGTQGVSHQTYTRK